MTFATDQNPEDSGLSATAQRLLALREPVLAHWETETRARLELARHLPHPILINTLPAFYDNLAEALSPGYPRQQAGEHTDIAAAHGDERARMTDYGPEQVIQEYQLFRDAFVAVVGAEGLQLDATQWATLHASIDSAVRDSVKTFTVAHRALRHRVAAALSHDMRAPLANMVSGAQLLGLRADADQHCRRVAARIEENGQRLAGMIEELLEALSVDHQATPPPRVEAADLFDIAAGVCREINDCGAGQCELSGQPVPGYWSRNAMRRAVENLAGNAIKYGDGGPVRIHVTAAHQRALLSVHNAGAPIASDSLAHVFDYLWREGGAASVGWGIGLPYVRSVAESHGGSALVDSSVETGTTFTIDVPIDCRPLMPEPPST